VNDDIAGLKLTSPMGMMTGAWLAPARGVISRLQGLVGDLFVALSAKS
jgi:hypothetical protein